MEIIDEDQKLTSTFNDAGLQIQRLNNFWVQATYHKEKGHLARYKFILDNVEDELYFDAESQDDKSNTSFVKDLREANMEIDFSAISKDLYKFYLSLRKKERLLRKIQNLAGKGATYKKGDDDYLD